MGAISGGSRAGLSTLHIPHFVSAKNAEDLKKAMLDNNRRLKVFTNYFSIQWVEGEGKWYAWYLIDLSKDIDLKEAGE